MLPPSCCCYVTYLFVWNNATRRIKEREKVKEKKGKKEAIIAYASPFETVPIVKRKKKRELENDWKFIDPLLAARAVLLLQLSIYVCVCVCARWAGCLS
jgi:hypothetical protein